ncbi:MAG TPA: DUF3617 family protein [Hyphomicrobium sp.]|nr:DUF3617 family protein [Hyphomicrobium sp.]
MCRQMWAVILLILCMSQVRASDQVFAGLYEVDVSLELPHVLDAATRKTTTLCLNEDEGTAFGLAVLSDNNPLANCPVSAILRQGNAVSFDIICPGVNAAQGHAAYRLAQTNFEGRIEMKMGGKNMTMTEVQSGRRIADCHPAQQH